MNKDFAINEKIIETERLILRKYYIEDFDNLKKIIGDPLTMSYYPCPYDDDGVRRWIEWNLSNYQDFGFGLFVIIKKDTGEFIGDCGITIQNINHQYRPEIGYHINKQFWKQGFAKEAGKAVISWAFKNNSFNALYSYMTSDNEPSYKTALSFGMKYIEEYIQDNVPHRIYRITRKEWENNGK